jgi:hypothetical protein
LIRWDLLEKEAPAVSYELIVPRNQGAETSPKATVGEQQPGDQEANQHQRAKLQLLLDSGYCLYRYKPRPLIAE